MTTDPSGLDLAYATGALNDTVGSISDLLVNETIRLVSLDNMEIEDYLNQTNSSTDLHNSWKNKTVLEPFKKNSTLILYDFLIPSIGFLVIVLNLAVVVSSGLILKKGQQPRSTYLLLGNVAMTDLVTAISVVFGQIFPKTYRDHYVCAIQIGMIVSSSLASILSVGMIAMERYLYILHGLLYQKWVYPRRVRKCILASWFMGCLIGFLPLMGWSGETYNGQKCWFILLAPKALIALTVLIGAIPILAVIVLYSVILYHSIKNIYRLQKLEAPGTQPANGLRMFRGKSTDSEGEEISSNPNPTDQTPNTFRKIFMRKPTSKVKGPNKWRAIKVVFFTSGSFLLTWGPYFVASLMYAFGEKDSPRSKTLSVWIASPLAILGFVNSLINPIIYAWWHKGFRGFIVSRCGSMRRRRGDVTPSTSSTGAKKSPENSQNGAEAVKMGRVERY